MSKINTRKDTLQQKRSIAKAEVSNRKNKKILDKIAELEARISELEKGK